MKKYLRYGFSLIELMVVIAVSSIVIGGSSMILSNVSFFSNIFDDKNKKSLEYAFVQNMLRDDIIHILPGQIKGQSNFEIKDGNFLIIHRLSTDLIDKINLKIIRVEWKFSKGILSRTVSQFGEYSKNEDRRIFNIDFDKVEFFSHDIKGNLSRKFIPKTSTNFPKGISVKFGSKNPEVFSSRVRV